MARRLHLVVDTGVDDALAIVGAWLHPDLELAEVTAAGGNVTLAQAVVNTRYVLHSIGATSVEVSVGAAHRCDGRPFRRRSVHGPDGLGGLVGPISSQAPVPWPPPASVDASSAMLVCLAPMTTLLDVDPGTVVATYARPGQANHAMDTAAADGVRARWLVRDADTSADLSSWVFDAGQGSAVTRLVDHLVHHQRKRGAGLGDAAAVLRLASGTDPVRQLAELVRP